MFFYRFVIFIGLLCLSAHAYCDQQIGGGIDTVKLKIADYDKLISKYRYYKPDSALYFTQKAIALAKSNKDDNGLAKMLNQMGMIQDNMGRFDESRENYITAKALYEHTGEKKGIATEMVRLGVIESRKGNYDKALTFFLDALKISDDIHNPKGSMESYLNLAELYMFQQKGDIALSYLLRAQDINKTIPFSNLSLNIYNNFGYLYTVRKEYDKAKPYLEKGLAMSNKPEYQGLNITLTNTMAMMYAKQGLVDTSIVLQKQALVKSRAIHNYIREYQTLMGMAETYSAVDPKQSLIYYRQALVVVAAKGGQKQALEIWGKMAEAYHALNDDKQAYAAKQNEYDIADKYFFQRMAKQIVSLQSEYDLNKSNAKVQQLKYINARQSLKSNVLLGFAIGVILLLGIVVLYYYRTRKLNDLLNSANTELKDTNTVKDKLFSVLAHDLRAPFSTMIGLLQLINDDDLTATERKELIDLVSVTSNASLDILNNLLKWGEMQIKGIRLNPADLQPRQIIERNVALLLGAAEIKSITLSNLVATDVQITADPDHFEFVVRNLLSNAVKFTQSGGKVTISSVADDAGKQVRFIVQDNGVGIAPQKLHHIFDLSNVSTDGTNDEKGTSLGLVLCKEFIEANHGRIWVESQPGQGSSFIFELKKA